MDFSEETVCSVKKENNSGYYRLHTIWRNNGFFINVVSKNGAWRGEVRRVHYPYKFFQITFLFKMTAKDVAKMSSQLEVEPEFYMKQCKNALTYHGGRPGVVYAVEDGSFVWKKVEDEDSGIKIKLGSIMLEPSCFEDAIQNLVTAALNSNKNLQEKLKEMTEDKSKILKNKNELLNKLNELIATKDKMENDLYARFILLSNAKKRKISGLEHLLNKKFKHSSVITDALNNPYDTDTDIETDEEEKSFSSTDNVQSGGTDHIQKNVRKYMLMTTEEPREKKSKSTGEDSSAKKKPETSNYIEKCFSEPTTSSSEPKNNIKNTTHEMSLTQMDLYDYFYGEL